MTLSPSQAMSRSQMALRTSAAISTAHRHAAHGIIPVEVAQMIEEDLGEAFRHEWLYDGAQHARRVAAILAWKVTP